MSSATTHTADAVLDDAGLLALLKLPEGSDLAYFRQKCGLPHARFRVENRIVFRYITSEVMRWLKARQAHPIDDPDQIG